MAHTGLRRGSDYQDLFNPKEYLKTYYARPKEAHPLVKFALETVHEIYSTGKIHGKRFIDIGSGPTIHMTIPATEWFDEIFLSDFSKKNIEAQKKWLAREPDSYDWQYFFRYFAEKDGSEESWSEYEDCFRDKVKRILDCDVNKSNPLYPESTPQFDAVSSNLALEAGCKDLDQFRQAMKNVTSLLAPGGFFILFTILQNVFYVVGDEIFWALPVTAKDVRETVVDADLEIVRTYENSSKQEDAICTYNGCMMTLWIDYFSEIRALLFITHV